MNTIKLRIKELIPPLILDCIRSFTNKGIKFYGTYTTWDEAMQEAQGYDADAVLAHVCDSTLKVLSGEAAAERDSVLFDKIPYPFPVISVLLRAACERGCKLNVLDFGGALGSSYYQSRNFLGNIEPLHWHIVEQKNFVEYGQAEIENKVVRFFDSIESCVNAEMPDVILLSGVLQYLADPLNIIGELCNIGAQYIVIDRTPIAVSGKTILTVQVVPEKINQSSYPSWFFSEVQLKEPIVSLYEEIADFEAVDGLLGRGEIKAQYKGFIFKKKQNQKRNKR